MNATEALKQARELLREYETACSERWRDFNGGNTGDCMCPKCTRARAFLDLPSPVEEGTNEEASFWNKAIEASLGSVTQLRDAMPGEETVAKALNAAIRSIRALLRDTSKPEEKR